MTSTINFVDLSAKMTLLKELHTEGGLPENEDNWDKRERYIALRREVAGLLLPMFKDLEELDMLIYVLFGGTTAQQNMVYSMPSLMDGDTATCGTLGEACVNGGIQLSLKN